MTASAEAIAYARSSTRALMEQLPFLATREEVAAIVRTNLELAFDMGSLHAEAQHDPTDLAAVLRERQRRYDDGPH